MQNVGIKALAFVATAIALCTACTPTKLIIADTFVPGTNKVARSSIKYVGSIGEDDNQTDLTNYYIQICDMHGKEARNCQTSLILANITDFQINPYGTNY